MITDQNIEVNDCGALKTIVLPAGWREQEGGRVMPDGRFVRTFAPPQSPQTHFCLYYRPTPLSLESGRNFLEILVAPFHDLTKEEIARLSDILESMARADSFEIESSGTGYLSGKRVLRLVGNWKQAGTKTVCVFTNADDDGCVIQQIYFSAPQPEFETYLEVALASLLSVSWN